jgi:uncharacterized protein YbjT (DUF2867 family)
VTRPDSPLDFVLGASGYIGSNLVPFLLGEGRRVRAASRNVVVIQDRDWPGAELVTADALDPPTLDAALRGVDTAYYLVHSMAAGPQFPELDRAAARNFRAAASRCGVRRIIYLGGLTPGVPESAHLRSRRETGDILREGEVPVTEIRAGMIIGPGSAAWEVIRDLVNYLPVMVTPRWVRSRSTPIALGNLLRYLADAARYDATAGEIYDVGGPDVLTYLEIMRQYGELVGRRPLIVQVPVLTPRLSSYWLRLVTSVPTNVARALIDGLSQDVIARDDRLARLIPQRLLSFREAARVALDADRKHDVPARWVESWTLSRDLQPEYSYYAKQTGAEQATAASRRAVWDVILSFGEGGDFFFAPVLWWFRRALDWLVGGPGFRRNRRHPRELRIGDVVDTWRVISIVPEERLTLLMEMRAPGAGVLEYVVADRGAERVISVTAYFHPAGVWGLMYWYVLLPFHGYLFRGKVREIGRRAAIREAELSPTR